MTRVAVMLGTLACLASSMPGTVAAQRSGPALRAGAPLEAADDSVVTTRHQITVGGRTLRYTARAGHLPIRESVAEEVRAHVFFVAYTLDRAPGGPARPLTFVWNGGPGAPASLLNLAGLGPRRVALHDDPTSDRPVSETTLLDNDETWLDATDLVFVDPVNTGYSRPATAADAREFWNFRGDVESVAEFIRTYLARYDAWDAPLFIAGESYGSGRAAAMTEALPRRGVPLTGAVLISGVWAPAAVPNDVRAALALPSYTAAAFAQRRLPTELATSLDDALRQAEAWATTEYLPALAQGALLDSARRRAVAAQLARFTGLDARDIDTTTLRVDVVRFARRLLRTPGRVVGQYDSRVVGPLPANAGDFDPTDDPSLRPTMRLLDGTSVLLRRYLGGELGFRSDMVYSGPFGGGWPPATTPRGDWMSVRWDRSGPDGGLGDAVASLRRAITRDSTLSVFVAAGVYDLTTPYYAARTAVTSLGPALARHVTFARYLGGHSMYDDRAARVQLKRDVSQFMQRAIAARAAVERR